MLTFDNNKNSKYKLEYGCHLYKNTSRDTIIPPPHNIFFGIFNNTFFNPTLFNIFIIL